MMDDTTKTFLPPTPSEVFSQVMPTMADVDFYFDEVISKALRDTPTARSLLAGRQLSLKVDRVLYKSHGDEILNRLIEQGWDAKWDKDHAAVENDDTLPTKTLIIEFTRKKHDAPEATAWGAVQDGYKSAVMNEKPKRVAAIKNIRLHHVLPVVSLLILAIGVLINPPKDGSAVFAVAIAFLLGGFIGQSVKDLFNGT